MPPGTARSVGSICAQELSSRRTRRGWAEASNVYEPSGLANVCVCSPRWSDTSTRRPHVRAFVCAALMSAASFRHDGFACADCACAGGAIAAEAIVNATAQSSGSALLVRT
jgi:hypothetical protein